MLGFIVEPGTDLSVQSPPPSFVHTVLFGRPGDMVSPMSILSLRTENLSLRLYSALARVELLLTPTRKEQGTTRSKHVPYRIATSSEHYFPQWTDRLRAHLQAESLHGWYRSRSQENHHAGTQGIPEFS